MALGDGEPLHGGELVGARRVRDLEGADRIVGRYHLKQTNGMLKSVKMQSLKLKLR